MVNKKNILWVLVAMMAIVYGNVYAAIENPTQVIKSTVLRLQKDVEAQQVSLENNPDKLYNLVQKVLVPKLAMNQMAGRVLGPRWRKATPAQRKEFVEEFSKMVTRNYASVLLRVGSYKVIVNPLRAKWEKRKQIIVSGKVINKQNNRSSAVNYYLNRKGNSWQIYDFAVEGVSVVNNFRSQFQEYSSITALISKIKEVNAR